MKRLSILGLPLVAILGITGMVLASTYSFAFTVTNSGGSTFSHYPVVLPIDNSSLVAQGYLQANGLDARVLDGSTQLPSLLADDKTLFVGNLNPHATKNLVMTVGNTPAVSRPIIAGEGGHVVTPDNTVELGDDFGVTLPGYFDTTKVGQPIAVKPNTAENTTAFYVHIGAAGEITAEMPGAGETLVGNGSWVEFGITGVYDVGQKMVRDPNTGRIYIGAERYTDYPTNHYEAVGVVYSDDDGLTWAWEDIYASIVQYDWATAPNLAITSDGDVYAIFWDYITPLYGGTGYVDVTCAYRWHHTGDWDYVVIQHGTSGEEGYIGYRSPVITMDSSDVARAAWATYRGNPNYDYNMYYSFASQNAWGAPTNIYNSGDMQDARDIGVDSMGRVFLMMYVNLDPPGWDNIAYMRYAGSWTGPFNLGTESEHYYISNFNYGQDSLVVDPNDTVHFATWCYDIPWNDRHIDVYYRELSPLNVLSNVEECGSFIVTQNWIDDAMVNVSYSWDGHVHVVMTAENMYNATTYAYHFERDENGTWTQESINYDYRYGAGMLGAPFPEGNFLSTGYAVTVADWSGNSKIGAFLSNGIIVGGDGGALSVTATGISAGYHTAVISADGTDFTISVDGTVKDTASLNGSSVPDTDDDWTWMSDATPYLDGIIVSASAIEVLRYEPNTIIQEGTYGILEGGILPDRSGAGNDGLIIWGANAGAISTALGAFTPTDKAQLVGYSAPGNGELLGGDSPFPPTMYTEMDTSRVPGGSIIDAFLLAGDIPKALWWYPFLFIGLGILAMLVYGATQSTGGEGSLFGMVALVEVVLVFLGILET